MRGRKPKPTTLRLLQGNARQKPLAATPQPPATLLECPSHLHGEARKKWKILAPQLYELGLLTELDHAALEMLCWSWSVLIKAGERLAAEGLTVVDRNGVTRVSPWVKIECEAQKQLRALCAEFGMTPSSRSRVHAVPPPSPDPFEELLNSR
jgi:P27 family predicted phage terminase small subunit